jgi:hypothetical protein
MRLSHRVFLALLAGGAGIVSALAGGCSGSDPAATSTGKSAEDLYAAKGYLWPGGLVDVCFESNSDPAAETWHSVVRAWVTSSWEQSGANITFNGWGLCDVESPGDGIRIAFQDVRSHSLIGTRIAGEGNGMVLNYQYQAWPAPVKNIPVGTMLGYIAVHEFGHALGFPHEQDRPDALSSSLSDGETACIERYLAQQAEAGTTSDWLDEGSPLGVLSPIGTYDHLSVMNYCNTAGHYQNFGVLSAGDIAGVRALYPPQKGAHPINRPDDPISSRFPLSTVNLQTPGNTNPSCTGVILAATKTTTKILTAAHCKVNSTTTGRYYPTTASLSPGASLPSGAVFSASTVTPVAIPSGVVCDPDVPGSIPRTCYVNAGTGTQYYADLAVLTVDSPPPDGYVPVALGASGALDATPSDDSWEVGSGYGGPMQWAPTDECGADVAGSFVAAAPFAQRGDTGGPVFQEVKSPLVSKNGMILIGIASTLGPCTDSATCGARANVYTNVVNANNYTWLTGLGGAPAQTATAANVGSFGASL